MTLRRVTPMKRSAGTRWPAAVREHVYTHQPQCLGTLTTPTMPGYCMGGDELDHVRSWGMGIKSPSVATNASRLCAWHHSIRTREGRTWRPRLLSVIARLHSECARCQRESIEVWGQPLEEGVA